MEAERDESRDAVLDLGEQPAAAVTGDDPTLEPLPPGLGDHAIGEAAERFTALPDREPIDRYNYAHFRMTHLLADLRRTLAADVIRPGEVAPDFTLPCTDGGWLRLNNLRGMPVLLHFGSGSSPFTVGSVAPLKKLCERWSARVEFVDVFVRQAHPGPGAPPYRTDAEKLEDAGRYQRDEDLPWRVLVDDLQGTVHQVYGGLPTPTYLLDVDGHVAYVNLWTHAPTLHRALQALFRQECRGIVGEGIDRMVHPWPALTDGWRGVRRGLPQSYLDLELALPGSGTLLWCGHQLRPALAPLTLRATPLPRAAKAALALGVIGAIALGARVASPPRRLRHRG